MTNHEATEQAYKKGYEDGYRDGKNRVMENIAFRKFLVKPPEPSKEELEALLHAPTTIIMDKETITPMPTQSWNPASEPPKDDTEDQWVVFKIASGWQYTTGYFDGKDWRSAITDFTIPVVGWMPLPQPPKGE